MNKKTFFFFFKGEIADNLATTEQPGRRIGGRSLATEPDASWHVLTSHVMSFEFVTCVRRDCVARGTEQVEEQRPVRRVLEPSLRVSNRSQRILIKNKIII